MALTEKFHVRVSKKKEGGRKKPSKKKSRTKNHGVVFALAGVHGIGKTTIYDLLNTMFDEHSNVQLFPERLRANPPVPFGSKNKQTAFRAEIHYNQQMIQRNEMVKKFTHHRRENIAILDRSIYSTLIYTRALSLPKIDYELILDTFTSVDWLSEHIIYLEAKPKTIMDRIYYRGSLDEGRKKWNEEDHQYLVRVLQKYEDIFEEYKINTTKRITRIWTDDKAPIEVVHEIVKIIEEKAGLQLKKILKIPANQAKLTSWFS